MDFKAKINELLINKTYLQNKALEHIEKGETEEAKKINDKLDDIVNQIKVVENLANLSANSAEPMTVPAEPKKENTFNSLGEQLQAVYNVKYGNVDSRLVKATNEVRGGNESVGKDGGFVVQEDFAGTILDTAAQTGDILGRVDRYTVSSSANAARWVMVDETDITETVFGGVQTYWTSEGHTVAASKPQFREMRLELENVMGLAYATEELLQDAAFMSGFYERAFSLAVNRLLESSIIGGDGAGKPLGILNSSALVTVAKETSQAAGSVMAENFLNMWSRCLYQNRKNTVWLLHPDLEPLLPQLTLNSESIWMPEGGISGSMYQTILGRPVIFNDQCSEIGTKGDVILSDLSQYMLLTKGTAKQDWSMHVEFLSDQMCFRVVLRVNGAPKLNRPITLKNSKNTRSPFVTLAARG